MNLSPMTLAVAEVQLVMVKAALSVNDSAHNKLSAFGSIVKSIEHLSLEKQRTALEVLISQHRDMKLK